MIEALKSTTDHSPSSIKEKGLFEQFDGVYAFMKQVYPAYSRMRFRGSPYMTEPIPDLIFEGQESIADHMWASMLMWEATHPIMPSLVQTLNPDLISQFILTHDIGEIANGDVSAVLQLNGHGINRAEHELESFYDLTSLLPQPSQDRFNKIHLHYENEKNDPQTLDKNVLMAKIMDMIQGGHFVLAHSTNLSTMPDIQINIVTTKLLPYVDRLIQVLKDEGQLEAISEMRTLIKHHLFQLQKLGINVEF
ncbi:MAG: HD domain-containing protein [Candidatus Levybacteria bacterium]|nr:HD domain-containing protein [Candidatus Levybacteria bacterium]